VGSLAGRRFPDVPLWDLRAAPHRLRLEGGEGGLVVIGHGDCETSRLALLQAERLHRRRMRPLAVTAVLQDEPDEARALVDSLALTLPVLLDRDPYPLGAALELGGVPLTLVLGPAGEVREASEAFRRADFERFGDLLGVEPPLFAPGESVPALRPG
jgi:hypothetical protein